jgi:hypothetical protein
VGSVGARAGVGVYGRYRYRHHCRWHWYHHRRICRRW